MPPRCRYREGDALLAAVTGRSTQQVAFLDSHRARVLDRRAHAAVGARQRRTADRPLLAAAGRARSRRWRSATTTRASCSPRSTATASSPASRTSPAATRPARRCCRSTPRRDGAAAGAGRPTSSSDRIVAVTSAGHLLAFPVGGTAGTRQGQGQQADRDPEGQARHRARGRGRRGARRAATLAVKSGARTMTLSFKDLDDVRRRARAAWRVVAAGLAEGGRPGDVE